MNTTASSSRSPLTFFLLTFARSVPFPNDRSHYDPAVTGPILAAAAVIVTFLRGPRTLARFRFARSAG